ncbi:MAG: transposase [Armatimonadota bacterium]|nr:transposase [Armatimonadota bacterium]MDR7453131.1 transposase [Armatimonadota bacterium]MDR7497849.1 transposase [Armatimonadota bacterium]
MTVSVSGAPDGEPWPVAHRDIAFLLLDGLRRPRPARAPDVALCALGLTGDGRAQPLGMRVAARENEAAWRALLRELAAAGLGPRLLLVGCDGHPALLRAVAEVFPDVPVQVSVPHRLLALARKVPPDVRAACMAEARTIFSAADPDEAVARFRDWRARWGQVAARAVGSLEADLALCLTFYRFPSLLWAKIRSVNLVERAFREARRLAPPAPVVEPPPAERTLPAPAWEQEAAAAVQAEGVGVEVEERARVEGSTFKGPTLPAPVPSGNGAVLERSAEETLALEVAETARGSEVPPAVEASQAAEVFQAVEAPSIPAAPTAPVPSAPTAVPRAPAPPFHYHVDFARSVPSPFLPAARQVSRTRAALEALAAHLWVILLGLIVGIAAAIVF